MTECESCGEDGQLLFTCEYCREQFCLDHQFPHHGCARFSSGGSTDGSSPAATAAGPSPAGSAAASAAVAAAGSTPAASTAESTPAGGSQPSASTSTAEPAGESHVSKPSRPDVTPAPAAPDGSFRPGTAPVARDAARETRPDRTEPSPTLPGRGMPWERDGETPADWMRKQSLPGYVLKVTTLSLLFNLAYFGGLAAVVYGWL